MTQAPPAAASAGRWPTDDRRSHRAAAPGSPDGPPPPVPRASRPRRARSPDAPPRRRSAHVGKERRKLRRHSRLGVCLPHPAPILRPALLNDREAAPQSFGQKLQCRRHDFAEYPRAQRSAQHQQFDPDHPAAHNCDRASAPISGRTGLPVTTVGTSPATRSVPAKLSASTSACAPGSDLPAPAPHSVRAGSQLGRSPHEPRRKDRRDTGIAAETDNACRADAGQNAARAGRRPGGQRDHSLAASHDARPAIPAPRNTYCSCPANIPLVWLPDRASVISTIRCPRVTSSAAERLGGEEMAARPACRDDDRSAPPALSSRLLPARAGAVRASSMPMPRADGDHRGPAIGNERQRHAFGRDQLQRRGHVDEGLQAKPGDQAGAGQHDEQILLAQQPQQAAHHDEGERPTG